jgi:hypothetical protein
MRENTPIAQAIALKGLIGVLGVIGFLGMLRWTMSDSESGYRIGSAGIGMMAVFMVTRAVVTGQWHMQRVWTVVWLVLGIGSLIGAFIGSP